MSLLLETFYLMLQFVPEVCEKGNNDKHFYKLYTESTAVFATAYEHMKLPHTKSDCWSIQLKTVYSEW